MDTVHPGWMISEGRAEKWKFILRTIRNGILQGSVLHGTNGNITLLYSMQYLHFRVIYICQVHMSIYKH